MSNRLSDAMSKLNVESSRNSISRGPVSPGAKRMSGLEQKDIDMMFPQAAAALAKKKADFTHQTGNPPPSNRNSAAMGERNSLVAPTISAPAGDGTTKDNVQSGINSPWRDTQPPISRPKSSSGQQQPMGQFAQPPPSAGLRSPRTQIQSPSNVQSPGHPQIQQTTLTAPDSITSDMPILSPYNIGNSSWASMTNTPMVPTFNQQQQATQQDMVANATAMKLAALSTVNNRIALDDVRKYRRARSSEGQQQQAALSPGLPAAGIPATNVVMVNENGQILNAQQIAALQAHQQAALAGRRSRPSSPGLAMQGAPMGQIGFASPQNNGFLAAYDGTSPLLNSGMPGINLAQFTGAGATHEGYLSDHSEINRGRSPRGGNRRGSSKPPEDPTDPSLLQDIPAWLRSLRLHKYTDNLKDLKWTELVELDDKGLEDRGVNALGARNKMLKVSQISSSPHHPY
jgi:hypothetical protein